MPTHIGSKMTLPTDTIAAVIPVMPSEFCDSVPCCDTTQGRRPARLSFLNAMETLSLIPFVQVDGIQGCARHAKWNSCRPLLENAARCKMCKSSRAGGGTAAQVSSLDRHIANALARLTPASGPQPRIPSGFGGCVGGFWGGFGGCVGGFWGGFAAAPRPRSGRAAAAKPLNFQFYF